MKIDEAGFHALLEELTEENALACRGVLGISRLEFTDTVSTAAVSLEARPILRVNLEFVRAQCDTEAHVKALLLHEFLHMLLRHTLEIRRMAPAVNIALDAVINAIIDRKLGPDFSSFMGRYYRTAEGALLLLRAPIDEETRAFRPALARRCCSMAKLSAKRRESYEWLGDEGVDLWHKIYTGKALHEDVLEFLKAKGVERMQTALKDGTPVYLGNHADGDVYDADDLPGELASRLRASARELAGHGILPGHAAHKPGDLSVPLALCPEVAAWERQTLQLLRRLVTADKYGSAREFRPAWAHLPLLYEGDRRGLLRSLWNPLVGEIAWPTHCSQPRGSVAVYLDVSGSMSGELKALVALLHRFESYLRRPFWAFANTVEPAAIIRGELQTRSTGGTSIACVLAHLRHTKPPKALIITDGFVETLRFNDYSVPSTKVEVLLTSKGTPDVLKQSSWPITALPSPKSACLKWKGKETVSSPSGNMSMWIPLDIR